MNDKEILEELIERFDAPGGGHIIPTELSFDERNAIENLIKRNKDLEEIIDTLNKGIENHFIPKSKVKEKMKKYEWAIESYDSSTADYRQSQAIGRYVAYLELLQELEN